MYLQLPPLLLAQVPPEREFEVVVVDESESLLAQFMSSTMQSHFLGVARTLERLVRASKHTFWMDAMLSDRSLQVASALVTGVLRFVWNTHPGPRRRALCITPAAGTRCSPEDAVVAMVVALVRAGKRCVVMCGTKAAAAKVQKAVEAEGKACHCITSASSGKERGEDMQRVNEVGWGG